MNMQKNALGILLITLFGEIGLCMAKDVSVAPLSEKVFQAIRVDSLSAIGCDVTCKLKEVNDFDNNADTRKYIGCKANSGNVNIQAIPKPVIGKSLLPNAWVLTGGVGTDKLLRTVPLTVVGATNITASCVNTKTTTADVRPNYKLVFTDTPWRDKASGATTWDATLNVVSQSAANSSNFTVLETITYGFSISAAGVVTTHNPVGGGNITVTTFNIIDGIADGVPVGGVSIIAEYTGCAEQTLQWNQIITTSYPSQGCTSPYTDPCPNDDTLPYYFTDTELPHYITAVP